MAVKLFSESMDATITDEDQLRIERILSFWFESEVLSAPQIDGRMETWFGSSAEFDADIVREFSDDVEQATDGKLDHWANTPSGRLALILLLDQFRRNIFRGTADAFSKDRAALKLCIEGAMGNRDSGLAPIHRVFFYMPLQHTESKKIQEKSVDLYNRIVNAVSPSYRETFETIAQFAELHADIIMQFGRFPHRNKILNRENTP